jgi:D-aspartate ligase
MSVPAVGQTVATTVIPRVALRTGYRSLTRKLGHPTRMPAVVVGGTGPGTLGTIRSLGRAGVPVILLDEDPSAPAMHSRHGHKIRASSATGPQLVADLVALADVIGPAVLFLNSDDAALTVSEFRAQLENSYRFRLPSHTCVASLMHKASFQHLAQTYGFPVPRSRVIKGIPDLHDLAGLTTPCIVKPSRPNAGYLNGSFPRGYRVTSLHEAENICRRLLSIVPEVVVQEWIDGPDSELYFCLQYRGRGGATVASFTGRKLTIWPRDVGVTASCTAAAPDVRAVLEPLTAQFFDRLSFVGLGGIEFKRGARTGRFLMIEPTIGRVDGQEEVATLHGTNIPLAAYLYETGARVPAADENVPSVIWRDPFLHWRSIRCSGRQRGSVHGQRVYDAYWRREDPVPAFFHLVREIVRSLLRTMQDVPMLQRLTRSLEGILRRTISR